MFALKQIDEQAQSLEVMAVRLDDLFEWEGLNRLDFLKIDVEGVEEAVLEGAKSILARYRPIICMENWLRDVDVMLPEYRVFKKSGFNRLYIPAESDMIQTALQLGYREETAESHYEETEAAVLA
jgi:hypothetical protein